MKKKTQLKIISTSVYLFNKDRCDFKMFFLLYWIFKLLCKYNVDSFQYMRVLKHKQQDYEKSIISPSIKMLIFSSMTKSKARFSANYSEFTVYMHPSSFIDSGTSSIRPHKAPPQILFLSIVSGQLNMGWLPSFYLCRCFSTSSTI